MGFFSIQRAHTRKKKSFIHIYPALLIVGSFMVHDVCFSLLHHDWLGGFFFPSFFLFHSCVSGLIGFFLICLEHFSIETSTGASTLLE